MGHPGNTFRADGNRVRITAIKEGPALRIDRICGVLSGVAQTHIATALSETDTLTRIQVTCGTDTTPHADVTREVEESGRAFTRQGADPDIVVASARAYLNALNKVVYWQRFKARMTGP